MIEGWFPPSPPFNLDCIVMADLDAVAITVVARDIITGLDSTSASSTNDEALTLLLTSLYTSATLDAVR